MKIKWDELEVGMKVKVNGGEESNIEGVILDLSEEEATVEVTKGNFDWPVDSYFCVVPEDEIEKMEENND
jgi:hypothetical protein